MQEYIVFLQVFSESCKQDLECVLHLFWSWMTHLPFLLAQHVLGVVNLYLLKRGSVNILTSIPHPPTPIPSHRPLGCCAPLFTAGHSYLISP